MASQTEDRMATVLTSLLSTQPLEKTTRKRKREKETEIQESKKTSEKKTTHKDTKDSVNHVHMLPSATEAWEYERRLKQVATRGVVKLFNAVNKQQKELQSRLNAVGSSETKRSKVLSSSVGKKEFIDMLKGSHQKSDSHNTEENEPLLKKHKKSKKKDQSVNVPSWSLLRDDTGLETAMESWNNNDINNDDDEL